MFSTFSSRRNSEVFVGLGSRCLLSWSFYRCSTHRHLRKVGAEEQEHNWDDDHMDELEILPRATSIIGPVHSCRWPRTNRALGHIRRLANVLALLLDLFLDALNLSLLLLDHALVITDLILELCIRSRVCVLVDCTLSFQVLSRALSQIDFRWRRLFELLLWGSYDWSSLWCLDRGHHRIEDLGFSVSIG